MENGGDRRVAEPVPLVGREVELRWAASLVADITEGIGRTVMVDGEPGVGKTALLAHLGAMARHRELRVLSGTADEMERIVPYAAIGRCLGGQHARVPLRGLDAVLNLVGRWCAHGPVVLLLDDLHWADTGSVLSLYRLSEAVEHLPLLIVLARRVFPSGEEVDRLLHQLYSHGAESRTLGPLDATATAELVTRLTGARPDARLLDLAAAAAGNPCYVTELVTALTAARRIVVDAGVARLPMSGADLPAALTDAIRGRLASSLLGPTGDLLAMAATVGPHVDVLVLSAVLEVPFPELVRTIAAALRLGLLVESDRRLTFRHDLVRRALKGEVPLSVRGELHVRAARVLAERGAPVERVARHLMAGTRLEPVMLDWLSRSADLLVTRAPSVAVDVLTRASLAAVGDRNASLRIQLARAQLCAGHAAAAETTARDTLASVEDTAQRAESHWVIVQACLRRGRYDEAVIAAEHAAALAPAVAGRFHVVLAQCHQHLGRSGRARATLERTEDLTYDPLVTALRLTVLSGIEFAAQNLARAVELSGMALDVLGDREIPLDITMAPHLTHGFNLMESDRVAEADRSFTTGIRVDERAGGAFTPSLHLGRALVRWLSGRWDDAVAEIGSAIDVDDRLGLCQGAHGAGALIAVHRTGKPSPFDLAQRPAGTVGGALYAYLRQWSLGLAADARGERDEALGTLLDAWDSCSAKVRPVRYWMCPDLVRIADAAGAGPLVARLANEMTDLSVRRGTASVLATARLCRAVHERDPDRLLGAADAFRRLGRPLCQAYARESAGVLLARNGHAEQARGHLATALRLYAELGAEYDTAQALDRMRQEGVTHPPHPRRRGRTGWDAVTETEMRVAELVAHGLSNREIGARMRISRRTVQCHVSNILAKLSLRSRVEVAIEFARRA